MLALFISATSVWGQAPEPTPPEDPAVPVKQDTIRDEIEKLKAQVKALDSRLAAEEQKDKEDATTKTTEEQDATIEQISAKQKQTEDNLKKLNRRVMKTERDTALQRVRFSGDYRFEAHSIKATQPAHFDGMKLQNLLVKSMFAMNVLGRPPMSTNEIQQTVAANYSDYQYFTSNLTFEQLKAAMGNFPPAMQQQLFGMLLPETFVPKRDADNQILYTNRSGSNSIQRSPTTCSSRRV
jgi:hypothetical protein